MPTRDQLGNSHLPTTNDIDIDASTPEARPTNLAATFAREAKSYRAKACKVAFVRDVHFHVSQAERYIRLAWWA